jgi:3-oxoacyl-[acyl-carrier-protein] synthase II
VLVEQPITYFDPAKFRTHFACELKNFNAEDFLDRKEARKMDRMRNMLFASEEAVTDAGFDFETLDKDRAGVIWGSGIGGLETFQIEMLNFAAEMVQNLILSLFKNDFRYCLWSYFNKIWF